MNSDIFQQVFFMYLRGSSETQIAEIAEDIIQAGFESVISPVLPPTLSLSRTTVGNVAEVTRELSDTLFEIRYSIIAGRENLTALGNGAIILAGAYTGGRSAVNYGLTNSPTAKGFYAASAIFSAAAVTNGGMAFMANVYSISRAGIVTEALGFAFMKIGELAHVTALQAEGKPIPKHLLNEWFPNQRPSQNNGNIGFIMPGTGDFSFLSEIIAKIPFKEIGQLVGLSLTLYAYYKISITGYRYSQKLISKFKEHRQNKLLKSGSTRLDRQANFLVVSICNCASFRRTFLIYKFASISANT